MFTFKLSVVQFCEENSSWLKKYTSISVRGVIMEWKKYF